jgi:SEC-C motif-containing protein
MKTHAAPCCCGSDASYAACCEPYHAGLAASDAAVLMRSRYSAYVYGLEAYLRATWSAATQPASLALDASPQPQWLGLTLKSHTLQDNDHATVEFVARYKLNGRAFRLHELSRFVRVDGRWLYVDGDSRE